MDVPAHHALDIAVATHQLGELRPTLHQSMAVEEFDAAIERLEAIYARAARGAAEPQAGIEAPIAAAVSMR